MANNSTVYFEPQSGYDLPVYGLDDGLFYYLHIPAIACIVSSLTCAVVSVVISFRHQCYGTFFTKWTKSDRFIVYMAFCDGLFNVSHFLDHFHMVITKNHVRPKELCEFYGFCLVWFIAAQMLMVNVIAINIFMLMYFGINLNFGRYDSRLLLWTFGLPFVASLIGAITEQFGPFGMSCYFDAVKGTSEIWFTTLPSILVITVNITLYVLTWKRIHKQTNDINKALHSSSTAKASRRTARTMSMFVAVFVLQWFPVGIHSVWKMFGHVHHSLLHIGVILPNLGGCFNLAVCLIIHRLRRKHLSKSNRLQETKLLDIKEHVYAITQHTDAAEQSFEKNERG